MIHYYTDWARKYKKVQTKTLTLGRKRKQYFSLWYHKFLGWWTFKKEILARCVPIEGVTITIEDPQFSK